MKITKDRAVPAAIDLYWRDIKGAEPLSREKEVEFFRRA